MKKIVHLRCHDCKTDVDIHEDTDHEVWDVYCPCCKRNISRLFWIELTYKDKEDERLSGEPT